MTARTIRTAADSTGTSLPLDSTTFREAMSRIVSAVHVVTTDGEAGRAGATVSAMCSVSDDPASVLVCINRNSRVHAALMQNRVFCVNTLESKHVDVSNNFAGLSEEEMDKRFDGLEWSAMLTGSPALADARQSIDCEIYSVTEMGTHSVIIGTVVDLKMNEPESALLYVRRGYAEVER